jgi:hypothetical protein
VYYRHGEADELERAEKTLAGLTEHGIAGRMVPYVRDEWGGRKIVNPEDGGDWRQNFESGSI